MTRRFLAALQFLTVVPVGRQTASSGEAALWFPLVGVMLGASAGALMLGLSRFVGPAVGALLALGGLLAVTGCLHEDGLADVADAVRAGRSQPKMREILKDSRIGTYGAIALMLSIALRWQSMAQITVNPVAGMAAALALSRTSLVALAAVTPSVGTGLGSAFSAACSRKVLIATVLQAVAIVAISARFTGWRTAAALILASAVIVMLARSWFTRRLGGVNGDCLGATSQAIEVVNLVILAWHPST